MKPPRESLLIQIQRPSGEWIDVGILHSDNEFNSFGTFTSYWNSTDRPTLGQAFEDRPRDWRPGTRVALPRWFSHMLPEGRLRAAVAEAAHVKAAREFQLLARLGSDDLPGAVRALRVRETNDEDFVVERDEEVEADDEEAVLKFSLAGAQMKFSVNRTDKGLTIPVRGSAGQMILKLPDERAGFEGVPEAEFAAMTLAAAAGIEVADVELTQSSQVAGLGRWSDVDATSLLVRRFDRRTDQQRVHAEELAQVMLVPTAPAHAKYRAANFETVALYTSSLAGLDSIPAVIQRIVFNVLIGNGDAHTKNWAYLYPDGVTPQLSPAYDIVPTVLYLPDDDLGMNLDGTKSFDAVTPDSFMHMGEVTGFGAGHARDVAREAVDRTMSVWGDLKSLLPGAQWSYLNDRVEALPLLER